MKFNLKRFTASLLLILLVLGAVACNKTEEPTDTSAVETEEGTEAITEKATKKTSTQKATEPPKMVEDTTGLDLEIKMLTQNLAATDRIEGNYVSDRKARFGALIEEYAPDIIGTQEANMEWMTYLKTLEGYDTVGISREGKRSMNGEWNAILYNTARFVLMDSDTFWISSTPNKESYSTSAHSQRICTWAELFDTYTGRTIIVANTHLDCMSETVRAEQAEILLYQLKNALGKRFNYNPIYLMADLNSTEDGAAHDYIYSRAFVDARDLAAEDLSEGKGTYHGYGRLESGKEKEMNFCFHRGNDTVYSYEIIEKQYAANGESEAGYISDHYGVLVTFGITNE